MSETDPARRRRRTRKDLVSLSATLSESVIQLSSINVLPWPSEVLSFSTVSKKSFSSKSLVSVSCIYLCDGTRIQGHALIRFHGQVHGTVSESITRQSKGHLESKSQPKSVNAWPFDPHLLPKGKRQPLVLVRYNGFCTDTAYDPQV
jgi:hypothetical protein